MEKREPKIRRMTPGQGQEIPARKQGFSASPEAGHLSRTQTFLTKYYEPVRGSIDEDKRTGHKIYRLKGYTTVDKINRRFQQERSQRTLRHILTFLMVVILLIILIALYNPITNLDEIKKISGGQSFYKKQHETEITETGIRFP